MRLPWGSVAVIIIMMAAAIVIYRHGETCEAREKECTSNPVLSGIPDEPAAPIQIKQACAESQGYLCGVVAPANFPNILLVLAGFAGIFAAFSTLKTLERQTRATEDAVKIAAETERPILVAHGFQITNGPTASAEAIIQRPSVMVAVKNFGRIPAFLLTGSVDFALGDLPETPIYRHEHGWNQTIVEAEAPANIGVYNPEVMTPVEDIPAVLDNSKRLWIYGFIFYRDYFGSTHHMRFGKFVTLINRETRTFAFLDCENKNYTKCD